MSEHGPSVRAGITVAPRSYGIVTYEQYREISARATESTGRGGTCRPAITHLPPAVRCLLIRGFEDFLCLLRDHVPVRIRLLGDGDEIVEEHERAHSLNGKELLRHIRDLVAFRHHPRVEVRAGFVRQ